MVISVGFIVISTIVGLTINKLVSDYYRRKEFNKHLSLVMKHVVPNITITYKDPKTIIDKVLRDLKEQ